LAGVDSTIHQRPKPWFHRCPDLKSGQSKDFVALGPTQHERGIGITGLFWWLL